MRSPRNSDIGPGARRWKAACASLLACAAIGCDGDRVREIPETRTVVPDPSVRTLTSAERFGFGEPTLSGAGSTAAPFTWQLPSGWHETPPVPMRQANFTIDAAPDAECYLTVLPGGGGGVDANLARWRTQMSMDAQTPADRARRVDGTVLGSPAAFVEYIGTYRGMRGEFERPDFMLLGAAFMHRGNGVFLKFVGPRAQVDAERAHFAEFLASLTAAAAAPAPPAPSPDASASGEEQITWTAPPHWKLQPDRAMRLVTYTTGASGTTECYIAVLEGAAGGLDANLNRWRSQMGQPPLTAAEIADLPRLPMLGHEGRLIRVDGHFTGMDGATTADALLIGAVCELPGQSVFVKMVGPAAEVRAEGEFFIAFCRSLRMEARS